MPDDRFDVYDITLRTGTQRAGTGMDTDDRLDVARLLDDFGVGYIEADGDAEFFRRAREELTLRHAVLAARGEVRRPGVTAAQDPGLAELLGAGTEVVTVSARRASELPEPSATSSAYVSTSASAPASAPADDALQAVTDSVVHLRAHGRRVFVDCEHFFDGYAADPGRALAVVHAAQDAGAEVVVLSDTAGATLPSRLHAVVREVLGAAGGRIGVHVRDDGGCAVAGTLAAVDAGAVHVRCTAGGHGGRFGNADLFQVVTALELKRGRTVLPPGALRRTTRTARAIAEVTRAAPPVRGRFPGTGRPAPANVPDRPGADGTAQVDTADRPKPDVTAVPPSDRPGQDAPPPVSAPSQPDPALTAPPRPTPASAPESLSPHPNPMASPPTSATAPEPPCPPNTPLPPYPHLPADLAALVERRQLLGYGYESAAASLEVLLRGGAGRPYEEGFWRVVAEGHHDGRSVNEAIVELRAGERRAVHIAKAAGPVQALERALHRTVRELFPPVAAIRVAARRCEVLDPAGTTRVLLTLTDGYDHWHTVGVAPGVLAASWQALDDGYVHWLLRSGAGSRTGSGARVAPGRPATGAAF